MSAAGRERKARIETESNTSSRSMRVKYRMHFFAPVTAYLTEIGLTPLWNQRPILDDPFPLFLLRGGGKSFSTNSSFVIVRFSCIIPVVWLLSIPVMLDGDVPDLCAVGSVPLLSKFPVNRAPAL